MTTKLALYQKAAKHLSQERPATVLDDVHVVRELDAVYDDVLRQCLEEGLWLWSLRTVKISYDPSIDTTAFGGLKYGFTPPTDFVRIANINRNASFSPDGELDDYDITGPGKTIYSNSSEFYLKFVSNGATFGLNLAVWPETFAEGVGCRLGEKCAVAVTKSKPLEDALRSDGDVWMTKAKVRDAVDERTKQRPTGRLVRARLGSRRRGNPRGGIWD